MSDEKVQQLLELNKQRMARERAASFVESVLFLILSLALAYFLIWAGIALGELLGMDTVAGGALFVGPVMFFLVRFCMRMARARLALLRLLNQIAASRTGGKK